MKKTPWFPGNVKPSRPGVYERKFGQLGLRFSKFDGNVWLSPAPFVEMAERSTSISGYQSDPWRGLAEKP